MTSLTTYPSNIQFSITTDDPLAKVKPTPRYVVIDMDGLDTEF